MFLSKISPVIPVSRPLTSSGVYMEPLDYSASPVLDLCVRQKASPDPPNPPQDSHTFSAAEISGYSSEEGSSVSDFGMYPASSIRSMNPSAKGSARPFKAYPKDPFVFSIGASALDSKESVEAYAEFRQNMLNQVRGGAASPTGVCNPKMRRSSVTSQSAPEQHGRDASYWEKRRKNNEAAKRSRDARRAKEDEIAIRAAFLEQENLKLKYQLATLKNETSKLRCLLYN